MRTSKGISNIKQQWYSNNRIIPIIILFSIVLLTYDSNLSISVFALGPANPGFLNSDDCEFYDIEPPKPNSGLYIECCWADYTNTDPGTGELIFDYYCQICSPTEDGMGLECYDPMIDESAGPVTGGEVEPYTPPTLKDDAMNPQAGAGIDNSENTLSPTIPTEENIEPDKTVVEQDKKMNVPPSKNTLIIGPAGNTVGQGEVNQPATAITGGTSELQDNVEPDERDKGEERSDNISNNTKSGSEGN